MARVSHFMRFVDSDGNTELVRATQIYFLAQAKPNYVKLDDGTAVGDQYVSISHSALVNPRQNYVKGKLASIVKAIDIHLHSFAEQQPCPCGYCDSEDDEQDDAADTNTPSDTAPSA